jgi:hypothetical protein
MVVTPEELNDNYLEEVGQLIDAVEPVIDVLLLAGAEAFSQDATIKISERKIRNGLDAQFNSLWWKIQQEDFIEGIINLYEKSNWKVEKFTVSTYLRDLDGNFSLSFSSAIDLPKFIKKEKPHILEEGEKEITRNDLIDIEPEEEIEEGT